MDAWFVLLWDEDEEENFTDASKIFYGLFAESTILCSIFWSHT